MGSSKKSFFKDKKIRLAIKIAVFLSLLLVIMPPVATYVHESSHALVAIYYGIPNPTIEGGSTYYAFAEGRGYKFDVDYALQEGTLRIVGENLYMPPQTYFWLHFAPTLVVVSVGLSALLLCWRFRNGLFLLMPVALCFLSAASIEFLAIGSQCNDKCPDLLRVVVNTPGYASAVSLIGFLSLSLLSLAVIFCGYILGLYMGRVLEYSNLRRKRRRKKR